MKIDQVSTAQLAKLQKQVEQITGKDLDLSVEKLRNFIYPAASHDSQDGEVTYLGIFLPIKSCSNWTLLDVAGNSSTADDGKRTFLLTDFVCTQNLFAAPVNLVATPRSEKPCYTTTTFNPVPSPTWPGFYSDVQITVFTWSPNGSPAPNVSVDWRCRLPWPQIIL
jgi:hypothetical protein